MITLTNPETAAKFEATTTYDQWVHVPGIAPAICYRGKISGITPEAAARYVKHGGNLIKEKPAAVDIPDEDVNNDDDLFED